METPTFQPDFTQVSTISQPEKAATKAQIIGEDPL